MKNPNRARTPAQYRKLSRPGSRFLYAALCGIALTALSLPVVAKADVPIERVLPFDRPDLRVLRASKHKAFANWHVWPVSVDNKPAGSDWYAVNEMSPHGYNGQYYSVGGRMRERPLVRGPRSERNWAILDMQDEVRRAADIGLDGFAFSLCTLEGKNCWAKFLNMLQAAQNEDRGFKVMPMLDMPSLANDNYAPGKVAAQIASISDHPSVMRVGDGRMVLSAMTAERESVGWWTQVVRELRQRGVGVFFIPMFQDYGTGARQFTQIADGIASWGPGTPDGAINTRNNLESARSRGYSIYMGTGRNQNFRPKAEWYAEAANSSMLRNSLRDLIEGGADWMHIVSWSDRTEHTEIAPSTGIQWAFYDLAAYYITWFKMRHPPKVTRDVLYYFHRIHDSDLRPSKQRRMFSLRGAQPKSDQIELLSFLTAPGTVEVRIGGKVYRDDAPAGMHSFRVPLSLGTPEFRLYRNGDEKIRLKSAFQIRGQTDWQDLVYRGGSSTREVVDMRAD
jgi:hypothetical protein